MQLFYRLGLLLAVACMWSPTFLFIKVSLNVLGSIQLATARCILGSVFLMGVCFLLKKRFWLVLKQYWLYIIASSWLNAIIPFTLCNLGEENAQSSLAGIIEGLVPIFALIIGSKVMNKRLRKVETLAIMISFIGIILVSIPTMSINSHNSMSSMLILLAMAFSFACGFVYYERYLSPGPFLEITTCQLISASGFLLVLSLIFQPELQFTTITKNELGSILALGFIGTGLGIVAFFRLLSHYGSHFASLVTHVVVPFSVLNGVIFLNETIGWLEIIGVAMILLSLFLSEIKSESKFQ